MTRARDFSDLLQRLLQQGCIKAWRQKDTDSWYTPKVWTPEHRCISFTVYTIDVIKKMNPADAPLVLEAGSPYREVDWYARLLLEGKFDPDK